ncbi:hypothetical protein AMECASPLE_010370 [Ameca splendens]|uniref:Uncharacterized protein n=1 Tax=Ameca splendens TaxID=208324 RepID=A0ABV1A856_9TELE
MGSILDTGFNLELFVVTRAVKRSAHGLEAAVLSLLLRAAAVMQELPLYNTLQDASPRRSFALFVPEPHFYSSDYLSKTGPVDFSVVLFAMSGFQQKFVEAERQSAHDARRSHSLQE